MAPTTQYGAAPQSVDTVGPTVITTAWSRYRSPICGFSALFPGAPEVHSKTGHTDVGSATTYSYSDLSTDVLIEASCTDLTNVKLDRLAPLRFVAHEAERLRAAFNGTLVHEGDATIDGRPAMAIMIAWSGEDAGDQLCTEFRVLPPTDGWIHSFAATTLCDGNATARTQFLDSITLESAPKLTGAHVTVGRRSRTPAPRVMTGIPQWCAENGSCYGDISTITGQPKTIPVAGYFRHDGTYVRGYFRSHARRR